MQNIALVVIDVQNDSTKNYKQIIDHINAAIAWAADNRIHVVYIRHENLSAGTRTFKPDTRGAQLVADLKIVSEHVFTKYKGSILTCKAFADFIASNDIREFYIAGADAVACVKSSCYNLCKANYRVCVLSDCITSYDLRKIPEMLEYYASKGCRVMTSQELRNELDTKNENRGQIVSV